MNMGEDTSEVLEELVSSKGMFLVV